MHKAFEVKIEGISPLLMHSSEGLNPYSLLSTKIQALTSMKKRSQAEDKKLMELECMRSIWWEGNFERPTLLAGALRAAIEKAARKSKQGTLIREGILIEQKSIVFNFPEEYGEEPEELAKNLAYTVPVRIGQNRILRTRAKFDVWSAGFRALYDGAIIDEEKFTEFLEIAGQRIGIGDWRPEKSGQFGRFVKTAIKDVMV